MKLEKFRKLFRATEPEPESLDYALIHSGLGELNKEIVRKYLALADEQGVELYIYTEFPAIAALVVELR